MADSRNQTIDRNELFFTHFFWQKTSNSLQNSGQNSGQSSNFIGWGIPLGIAEHLHLTRKPQQTFYFLNFMLNYI